MTLSDWWRAVLALVIWKEAEGEPYEGKVAVGWAIRNRVMKSLTPNAWTKIIFQRWQFSSLTAPGDGRLVAWPVDSEPAWQDSMKAADAVIDDEVSDPTGGATLYANLAVCTPSWLPRVTITTKIGNHSFARED